VSDATPTFYEFFLIIVCGAFIGAFLLSLLPLSGTVRRLLIAAGPVAAVVGLLIKSPHGLDAAGWIILAGYGVLAWFVGLALGYLIHRLFHRDGGESLWTGFVRLISLR
jgi:type IV secretory pathway TrbD component